MAYYANMIQSDTLHVSDDVRSLAQYLTQPVLWERYLPGPFNSVRTLAAVRVSAWPTVPASAPLLLTAVGPRGPARVRLSPPPPCPQVFLPERIAKQYGFDVGTAQYLQAAALLALVRMVYGLVPAEARQYTLYLKVCASAAANLRAHAAMPSKLR